MQPSSDTPVQSALAQLGPGLATGIGSWPGSEIRPATAVICQELAEFPHLPELPQRGLPAAMIGRTAARLPGLPVELAVHGWRLTDFPGRDHARAVSWWRADLDELAEQLAGWSGPVKVQLAGPWTLAASIWLPRGERAVSDPGARRDIGQSLVEAARELRQQVQRYLPQSRPIIQFDEPSLGAVLAGHLPTASGYGLVRAVPPEEVRAGLAEVVAAVPGAAVVHSCAAKVPIALLRAAGVSALSLDLGLLDREDWSELAESVEAGAYVFAGISGAQIPSRVLRHWDDVGLSRSRLAQVVLTPPCGLVGLSPQQARAELRQKVKDAQELHERSQS